jgi:hypothetical protein|tara:strand:- start:2482 stop:2727 length:246 start_codon:yes stop_codon:yes gene_type:complete
MIKTSIEHLHNSRMGYWRHFAHSLYNALRLQWVIITSIIHAVFPFVYKASAARGVVKIFLEMKQHAHLRKIIKQEEKQFKK